MPNPESANDQGGRGPSNQADLAFVRALAHPTRLRLLGRFRTHGPLTTGEVAEHFQLSSGVVSYHMRKLASAGLIHEVTAPEGRPSHHLHRWWSATELGRVHELPDDLAPRTVATLNRAVAQVQIERIAAAEAQGQAVSFNDVILRLPLGGDSLLMEKIQRAAKEVSDAAGDDGVSCILQFQILPE